MGPVRYFSGIWGSITVKTPDPCLKYRTGAPRRPERVPRSHCAQRAVCRAYPIRGIFDYDEPVEASFGEGPSEMVPMNVSYAMLCSRSGTWVSVLAKEAAVRHTVDRFPAIADIR